MSLTTADAASSGDASVDRTPFPAPSNKKGLQVQMVDDALALGVRHAALNFNLAQFVDLSGATNGPKWVSGGKSYYFQAGYISHLDQQIKALSDGGVVVSLILLSYATGDPARDAILLHPRYDSKAPNHLGAFNAATPEGARHFRAAMEFLAARYSGHDAGHGRVWNYIVGNEVNSHWFWANLGHATMREFADEYLAAVRIVHESVRKTSANARVYLSLEHHWNIRYPGGDATQAFPGREFIDYFADRARAGGDFDWHIAFHPYPENLFECRTWLDRSAIADPLTTPRITFKNLDVLIRYLERDSLRFRGSVRRVILSEQGFHCTGTPAGETNQAAAYAYAYYKSDQLPGIDAFILHRHVDHGQEGGLNLGLWSRKTNSIATPDRHRMMYDVFRKAGTPEWRTAFEFALPVIGIRRWEELLPPR